MQRRSRSEQSDQRQPNQAANIFLQPRASPDSTSLASRIGFPTMTAFLTAEPDRLVFFDVNRRSRISLRKHGSDRPVRSGFPAEACRSSLPHQLGWQCLSVDGDKHLVVQHRGIIPRYHLRGLRTPSASSGPLSEALQHEMAQSAILSCAELSRPLSTRKKSHSVHSKVRDTRDRKRS